MPQGSPAIHADGLDKLRRELRRVKDAELDGAMKELHGDLAEEIVEHAVPKVPVLEGHLRDDVRASGTVRDAIGRVGGKSVPYAPPIHWGWEARGIDPTPFLQDAAAELEPGISDRYDAAVARMLNRVITP